MKRFFLFLTMAIVLSAQSVWAYHWGTPSEFVTKWAIDRAFKFDNDQGRFGTSSETGVNFVEFPGYISVNCMSCDRYRCVGSNYAVSWVEYYLRNAATGQEVFLGKVNFTGGGSGDRAHIYNSECNVSSVELGNGATVIMDNQKRMYDDKWDGSKWIYFLIGYTQDTRNFMVNAGSNLRLKVKMYYDGNYSFEKNMDINQLIPAGTAQIKSVSWIDQASSSTSNYLQMSYDIQTGKNSSEFYMDVVRDGHSLNRTSKGFDNEVTGNMDINAYEMDGTSEIQVNVTTQRKYSIDGTRWTCTKASGSYPENNIWYKFENASTTLPAIVYPYTFTATDESNGMMSIHWTISEASSNHDQSPFYVQIATDENFNKVLKEETINYVVNQTNYEIQFAVPVREKGNVTYYCRLRRGKASYISPNKSCKTSVNTNYARILAHSLKVDSIQPGAESGKVFLSWQASTGIWNDSLKYELAIQDQPGVLNYNDRNVKTSVSLPTCQTKTLTLRVLYKGQAISTEAIRVTAPSERNSIIKDLDVSKGYYTNRVTIDWNIENTADNFHHFIINRRAYNESDTAFIELSQVQMESGKLHYRLEDQSCIPGTYYVYQIVGYRKCGDDEEQKAVYNVQDIGFSQPFGTVSGAVTFSGNQGVKNVAIHLEGQDNQQQTSLYLTVNPQDTAIAWIPQETANGLFNATAGTITFWAQTSASHAVFLYFADKFKIELQDNDVLHAEISDGSQMRKYSAQLTAAEGYSRNKYNHYTISWSASGINMYLNGVKMATSTAASNGDALMPQAGDLLLGTDGTTFASIHLDELVFYSAEKDSSYIASHYCMYLNGNEENIEGYYRFDEVIDGAFFDLSCNQGMTTYHSRHGYMLGAIHDSHNTPSTTQLSYRAYTDSIGNYLIKRIPFTDAGSLYRVVPELGIHKFSPTNRQLYFNTSASTHNNMDFTDESSFKVSGHVYFDNTDYPVEGCTFYVDGQPCTFNGAQIKSAADGSFSIQVPIGDHYIQVKKDRHTFTDDGRFPADPNNVGTLYTFDREITTVKLYDNTVVKVMGRVAGGEREQAKPHCLGVGVNNIGVAKILLTAGDRYNLNLDRSKARVFGIPDSVKCKSYTTTGVYGDASRTITIRTDSTTGEFYALLPPLPLQVKGASVPSDSSIILRTDTFQTINLERVISMDRADTLKTNDIKQKCNYNYLIDLIYRKEPKFTLLDLANGSTAMGMKYYVDNKDTIPLYDDKNKDSISYTLGHPVFKEGNSYRWQVQIVEEFTNRDSKDTIYVDSQPWKNGIVTIENELGVREVATNDTVSAKGDDTKRGGTLTLEQNQLKLDSAGTAEYDWQAGTPNIMQPYLLGARITYRDASNKMNLSWEGNNTFQGYVLGNLQEGNKCVTAGPDELLYILRCPPGSGSTAYWEKGTSTTTVTERSTTGSGEEQDLQLFKLGAKVVNGVGLGMMVINSLQSKDEISAGAKYNWDRQDVDINTKKVTATERISIVRTPERVGADADIFYGNSTNLIFGFCSAVLIEKDTLGHLHIAMRRKPGVGTTMKTIFALTQYDIIHNSIPDMISLRNGLLKTVKQGEYKPTYPNDSTANIYITTLTQDDPKFGQDSTYLCIQPTDTAKRIGTLYDEVSYYNSQVTAWKAYLAANERAKVMAIASGEKKFDENKFNAANEEYRKYKCLQKLYTTLKEHPDDEYRISTTTEPGKYIGNHYHIVYKSVCGGGSCSETVDYRYVKFADVKSAMDDNKYPTNDSILVIGDFYKDAGWFNQNKTVGGGVKVDATQSTTGAYTTGVNFTWSLKAVFNNDLGFSFNELGMINKLSTANGGGEIKKDNTTKDSTTVISYSMQSTSNENYTTDIYYAPDGFGPIFRTRAGQTACPYEGEQKTKFYEPGKHNLTEATIRLQNPVIRLAETGSANFMKTLELKDKPSGQAIPFLVQLQNASGVSSSVMTEKFNLRPLVSGDAEGLNISIDGYALGTSGQPITLTCGGQMTQTLTVQQTNPAINQYKHIGLILSSDCDVLHTADTCYFDIDFVAACAPLNLSATSLTVNRHTGDTLTLRLTDLNPAYVGLEGVRIQYRRQGADQWSTAKDIKKADLRSDNTIIIRMMDGLFTDGEYDIRAISYCTNGGQSIENESATLHVVRDMERPTVLNFLPESGIYSTSSEIGMEWSEAINTGRLTQSNFHISGALNGDTVSHAVALNLSSPSYTEARYLIAGGSVSMEMWVKYAKGGQLFCHADSAFVVRIEDDSTLTVVLGRQEYHSTQRVPRNKWCYLQIGIEQDNTGGRLIATCRTDAQKIVLFNNQPVDTYYRNGGIRIGGNGIDGAVHEFSIWTRVRQDAEIVQDMNVSLMSSTNSLVSYWHMNEGWGETAEDNVRHRTLHLGTNAWALDGANYALHVVPNSGVTMPIATIAADKYTNYTLELWFRAESADTLFRVMSDSIATLVVGLSDNSIYVTTDKTLTNEGSNSQLNGSISSHYLDGGWHQLRIVYSAGGTTAFMLDNERVLQISSNYMQGLRGDRISFESGFTGDIDEVRLWHARISDSVANERCYERMTGKEKGLKMCYSFEKNVVKQGVPATEFTLENRCDTTKTIGHTATLSQATSCPPLYQAPTEEEVSYLYIASADKIILRPTVAAHRLEGVTLHCSVENVYDLHDNASDLATWSVYVQRAGMVWEVDQYHVDGLEGESINSTIQISNISGDVQYYTITGAPTWMTLSQEEGVLTPGMTQDVSFECIPLAAGYHYATLILKDNQAISRAVTIVIHVTPSRPNWNVDKEKYSGSMNMVGVMQIDGKLVENTESMLAAFAGEECLGVATPKYYPSYNAYYIMLSVYGNDSVRNQPLTFKIWDAIDGTLYSNVKVQLAGVTKQLRYKENQVYGTMAQPYYFSADTCVQQTISLKRGWNWMSIYVSPQVQGIANVINPVIANMRQIKEIQSFAVVNNKQLIGSVRDCYPYEMYKVEMGADDTLAINGKPYNPQADNMAITLHRGWNWMGYISSMSLSPSEALGDLNPSDGDVLKSRHEFVIWDAQNQAWVGTLNAMLPGQGYMYQSHSTSNLTFNYPGSTYYARRTLAPQKTTEELYYNPIIDGSYPTTMGIVAQVLNGEEVVSNAQVAAFAGNECRGANTSISGNLWFVNVQGEDGDSLTMRVYVPGQGEVITNVQVVYESDAIIGSIDEPLLIQLGASAISETTNDERPVKFIKDGIIYIRRGGKVYSVIGQRKDL